jgi:hypothetical protein
MKMAKKREDLQSESTATVITPLIRVVRMPITFQTIHGIMRLGIFILNNRTYGGFSQ